MAIAKSVWAPTMRESREKTGAKPVSNKYSHILGFASVF